MYPLWLMFSLASINWASADANCTDYKETHMELLHNFGLDKNDNTMIKMRSEFRNFPTFVFVDLYVTSIIDVNEKAQSLSTQVKMITAWSNDIFWVSEEMCGIKTVETTKDMIWTPDILIKESIKTEFGTKESPYLQQNYFGLAVSVDILALSTACKMDLHRFPFDTQICNITFHSAVHTKDKIVIIPWSDVQNITQDSKEFFQAQGEWELISIDNRDSDTTLMGELQDLLIYQITIKRRPLLYFINIILPVFFFLMLDVTSFFIDSSGADKLSFKVTLLLSISVLLLILNDTLPSTTDELPLIGIYCSGIFSLIGISILETIFVNFLVSEGVQNRLTVLMETTGAVSGQDDGLRNQQIPPDSVRDQNGFQSSPCLTRVARVIDTTFLILYIITIIGFLSGLSKSWLS